MTTHHAVLVTGASSGMGKGCALRLAAGGFTVFAAVRKEADAQGLRDSGSPRLVPTILDVTKEKTISEAFRTIRDAVAAAGARGPREQRGGRGDRTDRARPSGGAPASIRGQRLRAGRDHAGLPASHPRRTRPDHQRRIRGSQVRSSLWRPAQLLQGRAGVHQRLLSHGAAPVGNPRGARLTRQHSNLRGREARSSWNPTASVPK